MEESKEGRSLMHVTERTVARFYKQVRKEANDAKQQLHLAKRFLWAQKVFYGHTLTERELKKKEEEWKQAGWL